MSQRPAWLAPVAGFMTAMALVVSPAAGKTAIRFSGDLSGLVTDSAGRPQPGATVTLFNKQDRLLQRAGTDSQGNFSFDDLLPDLYAVRITFSGFFPAAKGHIAVRPGMRSLLEINLSRLFSSVQLVATAPAPNGLMSDDWKWTLRADNSLRPILRFMPDAKQTQTVADSSGGKASNGDDKPSVFRESRGLVRISAAEGAQAVGDYGEADLGTQFAFETSIHGDNNRIAVTGDVGYAPMTGAPATALRTTFSRSLGLDSNPSFSVTMRQFFVPTHPGQQLSSGGANETAMPMLRTLGFSFSDRKQLGDFLSFEYGSEMDMVSLGDTRTQYFSPYARLAYAIPRGSVDFTYTAGNPRPELGMTPIDGNTDLQRDLEAVSVVPRVTLLDNRPKVEYGQDFETGVNQRFGSRDFRVSAYRENVANTALTIANPVPGLFEGDVMPDLFSSAGLFNAGRFETSGYILSATQNLGSDFKITAMFGSLGVLSVGDAQSLQDADDLRAALQSHHRAAFDLKGSGTIHATGTRFVAGYEWTDYKSALPGPMFSTESARPEPGFNIMVRQPIPLLSSMPGHLEACAELRNLLAQGYMPIAIGGQSILLVNTPRSFRGGLAFVF